MARMSAEFSYTITIGDEDIDVEVEYSASSYSDCVEVDEWTVFLGTEVLNLTPEQDREILLACLDRLDDDFQAQADAEGDYRYDMSREYND
jgi:hypothetical protein